VLARLPEKITAEARRNKYDRPLLEALQSRGLGTVNVAMDNTESNFDMEILSTGINIFLSDLDDALAFTYDTLRSLGAPKGSYLFFRRDGKDYTLDVDPLPPTVILKDEVHEGSSSSLRAYVRNSGDLVLEGQVIGPHLEQAFQDNEYEYWRSVDAADVPEVFAQLVKEKFRIRPEYDDWLVKKGFSLKKSTSAQAPWQSTEIRRVYRPDVLLKLIKERFTDETDFRKWLEEKGIKSEFGNWF